ncbi:hypothetical protein DPMN_192707 [Dreissena polymorpha]|uniref:Uncharacterized protein n=1 Tax=Dreissena polymorpha TaxID=45954 RepID=A0A9D4BH38_DREPO|nr:hypothetical protein DPMN_192707 [Dreissena polymorpha]
MYGSVRALQNLVGAGCQRALNKITERTGHCKRFSSLIGQPAKVEAVAERTSQTYGQGVKWHEQQRHGFYMDSKSTDGTQRQIKATSTCSVIDVLIGGSSRKKQPVSVGPPDAYCR